MVLLAYKENSSNKDKPRLKKKISPCPAVSQSESRSHLVNCINTLNLVNSPQFRWQFKQVCFILSYNLSWVPFQNWVAIFNLKIPPKLFLKSSWPPTLWVFVLLQRRLNFGDFYSLKWLWCTFNKLLLATLQHKAPTSRQRDCPATSSSSTEKSQLALNI